MKTILVDARNVFITAEGINQNLKNFLDSLENPKIILTNANNEEKIRLGILNMPYEVFSLSHNPDKTNPRYYQEVLNQYGLYTTDVIYFEHNPEAVESAKSIGINTYRYDKDKRDIEGVKNFVKNNI